MVGFEALLTKSMLPAVHPRVVGAKIILRLALCPEDKTIGNDTPVTLNSALLKVMLDTVTLLEPLLASVTSRVSVSPTTTEPKCRELDEQVSCGVAAGARIGMTPNRLMIKMFVMMLIKRTGTGCDMGWGSLIALSILNAERR
jgi:hypothetical protein